MTARTNRMFLSLANGVVLSLIGLSVSDWRFWVMAIWTAIFAEVWEWISRRQDRSNEAKG